MSSASHTADGDAVHPLHETQLGPDYGNVLGKRDDLLLERGELGAVLVESRTYFCARVPCLSRILRGACRARRQHSTWRDSLLGGESG